VPLLLPGQENVALGGVEVLPRQAIHRDAANGLFLGMPGASRVRREGAGLSSAGASSDDEVLPVEFQAKFHRSWVRLDVGNLPKLAAELMDGVGAPVRVRRQAPLRIGNSETLVV